MLPQQRSWQGGIPETSLQGAGAEAQRMYDSSVRPLFKRTEPDPPLQIRKKQCVDWNLGPHGGCEQAARQQELVSGPWTAVLLLLLDFDDVAHMRRDLRVMTNEESFFK